jgi:hypothetical protein
MIRSNSQQRRSMLYVRLDGECKRHGAETGLWFRDAPEIKSMAELQPPAMRVPVRMQT